MTRTLSAAAVGLFALASAACNRSPEGGTPGTEQTFRLTTAAGDTNLKPGEEKTIVINVSRDDRFTDAVVLKVDSQSPKIDARIDKTKMEASDKQVTLTVKAAADAPRSPHIIKVTGTPTTGKPASLDVRVEVVNP
ncbi:MAG TPA: hypothetical protein VD866_05785 [Urbifossiella sp.]|nr:hypothetical protein [Urbifossiella sp.]